MVNKLLNTRMPGPGDLWREHDNDLIPDQSDLNDMLDEANGLMRKALDILEGITNIDPLGNTSSGKEAELLAGLLGEIVV